METEMDMTMDNDMDTGLTWSSASFVEHTPVLQIIVCLRSAIPGLCQQPGTTRLVVVQAPTLAILSW